MYYTGFEREVSTLQCGIYSVSCSMHCRLIRILYFAEHTVLNTSIRPPAIIKSKMSKTGLLPFLFMHFSMVFIFI